MLSCLITRLVLVAIVVSALTFGLNPLAHWAVVSSGQAITGAKVDLADARAAHEMLDAREILGKIVLKP